MIESLKIYIIDILSILLPGALLIAVLAQFCFLSDIFLNIFPESNVEWINAVVYIGAAYMLGHFIFFIGSFLDEWIFENVKRVFWNDHRLAAYVIKLKEEKTGIKDSSILNAFKWSCGWLLVNHPSMYAVVERHIAESKFFRSLIVVLFISMLVFGFKSEFLLATIVLLFIVLSLVRYLTQRQKSIETAYQFIVITSTKVFDSLPDEVLVAKLTARNLDPCGATSSLESDNRKRETKKIRFCTIKRIYIVIQLCCNPFYKSPNKK